MNCLCFRFYKSKTIQKTKLKQKNENIETFPPFFHAWN